MKNLLVVLLLLTAQLAFSQNLTQDQLEARASAENIMVFDVVSAYEVDITGEAYDQDLKGYTLIIGKTFTAFSNDELFSNRIVKANVYKDGVFYLTHTDNVDMRLKQIKDEKFVLTISNFDKNSIKAVLTLKLVKLKDAGVPYRLP